MTEGYTLPEHSFSVEPYRGAWIQRAVMPHDKPATTPEALAALRYWTASNLRKFHEAP